MGPPAKPEPGDPGKKRSAPATLEHDAKRPKRKVGRPRKSVPEPNSRGLPSLPPEIIGRIASFLLPPAIDVKHGFLPPGMHPYSGPRTKSVQAKRKEFAYGGIPSGVRDVLSLARTCRRCEQGVSMVIGKTGDGKAEGKKRTMYIAVPAEGDVEPSFRFQRQIDSSNIKKVFDRIKESSDVLERLVFHQCPHAMDPRPILNRLDPFQRSSTTFPKLEHLQIGPNLCRPCTAALMHLFFGQRFQREYTDEDIEYEIARSRARSVIPDPKLHWTSHGRVPSAPNPHSTSTTSRWVDYDSVVAPNLVTLQLFIPESDKHAPGADSSNLSSFLPHIPQNSSIKMFELWLRENHHWGGLGVNGTSTAYISKSLTAVEQDLTDWARKEKDKSMTAQERLLAKFKANAAKVLPPVAKRGKIDGAAKSKGDDKMGGTQEAVGKDKEEDPSPDGDDSKSDISDVEAELKLEIESDVEDDGAESATPSTVDGPKAPAISSVKRHALAYDRWTTREYRPILACIARVMPNLVGLSVRRKGTLHPELTEGARPLDASVQLWVEPLVKLKELRYLDLGLAICGTREVIEFPIGLSTSPSRKGRMLARAVDTDLQALKRRKFEQDAKKAIQEGHQWRLEVLKRFLIPTSLSRSESMTPGADAPVTLAAAAMSVNSDGREGEGEWSETWPKGVKSGYVYAVDLGDRQMGNGLAIPWQLAGGSVQLGQPKKIKL